MTSPGTACQPLGALAMTVGTGLTWARWKAMDWSLARNWIRHWIGPNQTAYSMLIPWSHLQSHSVSGWNLWLHCSKKIGASFTRVFKVWISESLTCLRSLECEALIHKSAQHVTSKECRFCTVSWCFLWHLNDMWPRYDTTWDHGMPPYFHTALTVALGLAWTLGFLQWK